MTAFRTLWAGLVGLYEETLILLTGNLAALALNLPIALVLLVLGPFLPVPALPTAEEGVGSQWLGIFAALIAWLMPFLPTPGNVALAALCRVAAGPDVPRFATFREYLLSHWRLALGCSLISVVVMALLGLNAIFYATISSDWLRFASILWGYGMVFWLSMHVYLAPLMVHVAQPRLLDVYRRAALVALGHFGYTLVLLVLLLAIEAASVFFIPVYVLLGTVFVSLVQAHAFREIRRRHGDLVADVDEELGRL